MYLTMQKLQEMLEANVAIARNLPIPYAHGISVYCTSYPNWLICEFVDDENTPQTWVFTKTPTTLFVTCAWGEMEIRGQWQLRSLSDVTYFVETVFGGRQIASYLEEHGMCIEEVASNNAWKNIAPWQISK